MWKTVSAVWLGIVLAIGCATSADRGQDAGVAHREVVCHDARYLRVFAADAHACRAYLDTCLAKLTPAQRSSWDSRVGACIENTNAECFAEVPWC